MKAGALQLTITKIEKEKAYLIAVFPNKKIATERSQGIQDNLKQVKEFIKLEISEGEVVFNQNSLTFTINNYYCFYFDVLQKVKYGVYCFFYYT